MSQPGSTRTRTRRFSHDDPLACTKQAAGLLWPSCHAKRDWHADPVWRQEPVIERVLVWFKR